MMRLETDMMLMTTPDLDKYYLKRSIMKKDIEYVYINHGLSSSHMGLKEGALDAFDTVICSGPHISREVRAMQEHYDLPPKNIVEAGFPFGDELIKLGDEERANHKIGARREILIAPTWNEDNILDSCIGNLLDSLLCDEYHITVRPHPEYVKRYGSRMQAIVDQYADKVGDGLTFDLDFSTSRSIYSSDLIITDWSGVGLEFSVATKRPALYVNTKMKVLNENWEKLGCIPVELSMRDVMGMSISKEQTADAKTYANELLTNSEKYEKIIEDAIPSILYNVGSSAKVAATYILKSLTEKRTNKSKSD
jgi:YidC/Oxa1 family membrane protein insertase